MENKHGRIDLLTKEQIDWCNKHCKFNWFVKDDGKVYSNDESIHFKDKKIINLFLVKFGDCKNFNCAFCNLLKSLEGASESVSGYFSCEYCDSLKSLEGAPGSDCKNFYCSGCKLLEFIDGLKNTRIERKINYHNCPKLEKYDSILKDENVFRRWQKSEYTADEFMEEYDGYLEAKKYGI